MERLSSFAKKLSKNESKKILKTTNFAKTRSRIYIVLKIRNNISIKKKTSKIKKNFKKIPN